MFISGPFEAEYARRLAQGVSHLSVGKVATTAGQIVPSPGGRAFINDPPVRNCLKGELNYAFGQLALETDPPPANPKHRLLGMFMSRLPRQPGRGTHSSQRRL
jgi:hypothetical protein